MGLKIFLSHMAPPCLNMNAYRTVWTHFGQNFIFFRDLDHSTTHRVESQSSVRVLNLVCVGDTWPRSKLCSWRIIAHCAAAGVYDCSFSRSLSKPHKISKYLPRKVYGNTSSIKTNSKYQFSVINDKCKAENHTG